jgi:hypothetical protein
LYTSARDIYKMWIGGDIPPPTRCVQMCIENASFHALNEKPTAWLARIAG